MHSLKIHWRTKPFIACTALLLAAFTAGGALLYWGHLPEQRVRSAMAHANSELNHPLDALRVQIEQQKGSICEQVLKNPSKSGPTTYKVTCRITQEGFTHLKSDADIKQFRDAAGPLDAALRQHGWKFQPVGYEVATWMYTLTYQMTNNMSVSNLNYLTYRKQLSPSTSCEYNMLASDEAAGKVAVHVYLACTYDDSL